MPEDEDDRGWKVPLVLMAIFAGVPVLIIAVAFAIHSL